MSRDVDGPFGWRWVGRIRERIGRQRHAAGAGLIEACFGPLELRALEILWLRGSAVGVRAIESEFPGAAYTTLMTTLDRLYKKGVLRRRREARAYLYAPRYTRSELESLLARYAIDDLLTSPAPDGGAQLVLSSFVEAVGERDARMLDELGSLVRRARRRARHRARSSE